MHPQTNSVKCLMERDWKDVLKFRDAGFMSEWVSPFTPVFLECLRIGFLKIDYFNGFLVEVED